ncbi:tRNA(His) guanylyltransferase Thg1 family protein [Haloferula sp. BvORR071]|uniref:tRNA(His) guanylyltransferase Thg1 family protein n=1 Tax=Haloferula sp. BvORR071 TaxID=1396141 RepID=UPI0005559E48|nr:tRNA(His) guanylyltransferase Thg1 family protein [Haloferula sp. BvORR071]
MRFDELDELLRIYEQANDRCVPPGFHVVARLDGRGFTKLTKELMDYEAPYDVRFRDAMLATIKRLMECGFKIPFAYAQSDEISLLFHLEDQTFDRKHRKWLSVLSGEASATLSLTIGRPAVMDCRISELPDLKTTCDYFRWRMEDAGRNCLNSHCYWMLRKAGMSATKATSQLSSMTVAAKHDLLFSNGINFNDLPTWQKRGYGVAWEGYEKTGTNPLTGETAVVTRQRLAEVLELPHGDDYAALIAGYLARDTKQ